MQTAASASFDTANLEADLRPAMATLLHVAMRSAYGSNIVNVQTRTKL